MRQIKAILADDEEQLLVHLRGKLAALWPELIICGEAGNGRQALELIEAVRPHVAFLDIRMPGLSGIEVAKGVMGICRVVFITAHDEYAVEAFESEALDYILKPVNERRLEKTIKRLQKEIASDPEPSSILSETMERVLEALEKREASPYLQWIRAQYGNGIRLIPVNDVWYFKASDKYTVVMTRDGESLIKRSIKNLEDELDPGKFWRIHRGTIVNANQIAKVNRTFTGRYVIKLKDLPETLTVSRTYAHLFKQM